MPRKQPVIYEINTWVWLADLTAAEGREVTLASVPDSVWDGLAELHLDYVWLMGVWRRSAASRKIALHHTGLHGELAQSLPDLTSADVVGSAYSIQDYVVAEHLGGDAGLAQARAALRERGLGLLLDYVPNHVAVDHEWVTAAPECLVTVAGASGHSPSGAFQAGERCIAHGRDPYFPPWTDTAQVNAFSPSLRVQASKLLQRLATQCDGVRCDMAMLLLNDVFCQTWGDAAGSPPQEEFWVEVIASAQAVQAGFKFMAEAYWGLEHRLLELGFDWAYDKTFYDRLRRGDAQGIGQHLEETSTNRDRLVRFTENHDEPRAAAAFARARLSAAAVTAALLPGPLLVHDGQFEGRQVRIPVQLGRRPAEPIREGLASFHRQLLNLRANPAFSRGRFRKLDCTGWPDNSTHKRLVAWLRESDGERWIVVVNMADHTSQARIPLPGADLEGQDWQLLDPLNGEQYERVGDELRQPGLFVELAAWRYHVFRLQPGTQASG